MPDVDEIGAIDLLNRSLSMNGNGDSPEMKILHEPLTYSAKVTRSANGGVRVISTGREDRSYIRDRVMWERHGDKGAGVRLERHGNEMRALAETRSQNLHPMVTGEMERRSVNWTAGQGGDFAPPQWLVEYFAGAPRPGRVLADLIPNFDLDVGWSSVNIPRLTGTGAVTQQIPLNAAEGSQDLPDAAVTSTVVTIAGNEDVPLQMVEQSPVGAHFDWVVFTDMEEGYNLSLETALITGTGSNGQLLGVLNNLNTTPYNATITYTSASPTATGLYPYLGQAIAAIGHNRHLPPEVWLMNTSRVGWLGTSEDTQNRPLILANKQGSGEFDLAAFAVKIDDAITPTYGAGGNQDTIIACRPSDWLLLESDLHTDVMFDVLSGSLMARCQLRRYVAALCRYPGGHASVQGTGMIPTANF